MTIPLLDDLPDWIDPEAWRGFTEMRRLKKKPLTGNAVTRLFRSLERLREAGEDVTLVLNQSEDQGYTGVFPVSDNYYASRGITRTKTRATQLPEKWTSRDWAEH